MPINYVNINKDDIIILTMNYESFKSLMKFILSYQT